MVDYQCLQLIGTDVKVTNFRSHLQLQCLIGPQN